MADYWTCRDLGHNWAPLEVEVLTEEDGGGYIRSMRCRKCKTTRQQRLDALGYPLKNTYNYVTGYVAARGGQGGFSRDDRAAMRLRHLRETLGQRNPFRVIEGGSDG